MEFDRIEATPRLRPEIAALGSFVAIPDAFPDADPSVRNAVKVECTTIFSEEHRLQTVFSTDRVLIDLGAVDANGLDFKKLAVDCDLLKEIAVTHGDQLQACVRALQMGTPAGIQRAEEITKQIGLTEERFAKEGGGLFFLVVVAVAAVGASGCATLNSNKPFKQPTTPQPK